MRVFPRSRVSARARSRQRPLFLNCNSCARTSNARRLHALRASRVVAPGPGGAGLARLAAVARARAGGVRWPPGGLLADVPFAGAPRGTSSLPPSRREEWPLSDPGRFGSEAHRPAHRAGREPYGPDRGRSGQFRPFSGLVPTAFEISGMCLCEWYLCLVAPEGLEVRDPAGLDFRGISVPGPAPGAVGDRGTRVVAGRHAGGRRGAGG